MWFQAIFPKLLHFPLETRQTDRQTYKLIDRQTDRLCIENELLSQRSAIFTKIALKTDCHIVILTDRQTVVVFKMNYNPKEVLCCIFTTTALQINRQTDRHIEWETNKHTDSRGIENELLPYRSAMLHIHHNCTEDTQSY